MGRAGILALLAALALGSVVAGCASTTRGSGSVVAGRTASSAAPTDFPTSIPPFSSPAPASSSASESISAPPSTPPTSSSPSQAATPAECRKASDCDLLKSWDVGGGYIVAAFSAPDAAGGVGSAILMLARDRTPIDWHVLSGETPGELLCKVAAGTIRNCVLVDYVGAHGATAYPLLVSGDHLVIGRSVGTDTPGMHAADLDHDLLVEAYGLNNNYRPDYATGHVQWQTWRRTGDGITLASTGCGPLRASQPKKPKQFLTGTCDFG